LAGVFTKDTIANYSGQLGVLHGLTAIKGNLSYVLRPVTTQHSLTTQIVDVLTKNTASAMTYFIANFGKGNLTGQYLTVYGRYEDQFVLEKDGWRIDRRQVLYMVCIVYSRSYCSGVVVWSLMIHTHARQGPYIGNISIFVIPS
jgi:hypothetical protein